MFFFKKNKNNYSKCLFEHIVRNILNETIDRRILLEVVKKDLEPIVGEEFVKQFLSQINSLEKDSDRKKLNHWMERAEKANSQKIFD